jgi:hypothetical protein
MVPLIESVRLYVVPLHLITGTTSLCSLGFGAPRIQETFRHHETPEPTLERNHLEDSFDRLF